MKLSAGPSLDALRIAAKAKIDADAEACRHLWITPGAGQAVEYRMSAAEADAYMAAYVAGGNIHPDGEWPILRAESAALHDTSSPPTYVRAATLIQARRDDGEFALANIKRLRRTAKMAADSASTVLAINETTNVAWPEPRMFVTSSWLRWPFAVTREQN